jgi:tetratricopeptide (TPR) repeat protein/O-antigen ligase
MSAERANPYARIIEAGLWLTVFATPLVFVVHWLSFNEFAVKAEFVGVMALLLGAVWVLECAALGRVVWARSLLDLPVAAFLLWNLLSLLWTRYDYATLTQLAKYAGYALIYFLIVGHRLEPRQVRRLLGAALAGAGMSCLYGLAQFLGLDFAHWQTGDLRIISSLGNSALFGAHLALVLPLALVFFLLAGTLRCRVGWGALVGLMYFCLLLTYTRAAWLGLGVAVALEAALLVKVTRTGETPVSGGPRLPALAGLAGALVALTLVVAIHGPYPLGQRLASSFQVDLSNVQRMMVWRAAGRLFLAHPLLGTGAGTLMQHLPPYLDPEIYNVGQGNAVFHAHNEFLEQAAETGIVGLGLFLWLLGAFAAAALRVVRRGGPSAYLAAGLFCAVLAFLVPNLAGVSLRYATGALYLWVMLGLVGALGQPAPLASPKLGEGGEGRRFTPASGTMLVSLAVILAAVVGLGAWQIGSCTVAEVWLRSAMTAEAAGQYAEASQDLGRALGLNPYALAAYATLGQVSLESGDYARAAQAYLALQALDAEYPQSDRGLEEAYRGLGRYPEAIAAGERDVQQEHSPGALTAMGETYAAAGKLDQALAADDEAVRIVEQGRPWLHLAPSEVYLRRARVLAQMGREEPMERDLQRARQLDPQSAQPDLVAGDLARERGDWRGALADYETARHLQPQMEQPLVGLGVCYVGLGDFARAAVCLEQALALRPEDAGARLNLGLTYEKLGRLAEARRELERVAELGPGQPQGARAAALLRQMPPETGGQR